MLAQILADRKAGGISGSYALTDGFRVEVLVILFIAYSIDWSILANTAWGEFFCFFEYVPVAIFFYMGSFEVKWLAIP